MVKGVGSFCLNGGVGKNWEGRKNKVGRSDEQRGGQQI